MLFEISTSLIMSGLVGYSYLKKSGLSDADKIQKICLNCGLTVREEDDFKTIQLSRKTKHDWGMEYVYRIPLGLSFNDFEKKINHLRDGLNNKKSVFEFKDLKQVNYRGNVIQQIKDIIKNRKHLQKDVELQYDGMLHIKVLSNPLPVNLSFSNDMLGKCIDWEIPLGQTRYGFIHHDLDRGHITLAGATRKGKTVFLKLLITSLIHQNPDNTKLTLIDLKGGLAFSRFKHARQVETVATDLYTALDALTRVKKEMEEMKGWFDKNRCEDIKEAGFSTRHFIIVDEAAQISPQIITGKEAKEKARQCEAALSEIARIGAGLGYRLIYCSQYPTADVMNKQIKQNCDTVITYKLRDGVASRVVLDENGAEDLPVPGRAIYKTPDGVQIVQTPFIDNETIERIIKPNIVIKAKKEDKSIEQREGEKRGSHSFELEEM
ncbi:cell division protein FtsK [Neobacillus sp. MM2021_6]|uniref:FtsK/SpoIIIE domain-containing protein n=1 Tax=Bacillaceae TaxID=186817 RepID=UPI00140E4DE5|nr:MULTISPECIES: FtsK/SpoIIIE domain-containing protein [Bacillaceae]MBO0962453.1 cell division protein FtsK [Neobacillus sp. MM2021_6]NHC21224.1 cell division protein FtsK [Bacillus sp. MM2020_4]